MIKSNDLRLGNLVYFTGNGEDNPCPILELWKKECLVEYLGNHLGLFYGSNDIQPIPLSPEILEKAGFAMIGEKPFYSLRLKLNSVDELCWYSQDGQLRYQTQGAGFTRFFNTIHLHQLQNLFWALCGEELTVNL